MSEKSYKNYLDNIVTDCFNNHLSSLDWDENDPIQKAIYLRLHDASKQLIRKMKAKVINTSHCKIDADTEIDENGYTFCNNYKTRAICTDCNFCLISNSSEMPNSSFFCNDEKHYPQIGRCKNECEMCRTERLKNATKR